MRRVQGSAMWLVMSLVAACTAAPAASSPPAGSDPPSPSVAVATPAPSQPATFVAEADGYTLTVTADRLQVEPGGKVSFTATFHNGTDHPIDVAGGCGGEVTGFVSVPLPVEREGKTWSGIRQAFKTYALREGAGPGGVPALDPLQVPMRTSSCADYVISSVVEPGGSVTGRLAWKAEIVAGVDALAGAIPFSVSVGYDQLNGPPSQPAEGPMISWSPVFKRLSVNGKIDVVGQGRVLKSAGEIVDGALADSKFAGWLADRPATTWTNANLFLYSSPHAAGIVPKGPVWEVDLFRERHVPRNWAIVFIDPFDASFVSGTYCNVPCDR